MEPPPIYVRRFPDARLRPPQRFVAFMLAATCLAVLVVAAGLEPSPSGTGSHADLGLNDCQFLFRSGLPCPSCGMTTSFAWFARGHVLASLYVQPMGAILALVAASTFWISLYIAVTARPIYRLLRVVPGRYYAFPLMVFAVLAWGWKMFIHVRGLDGWR
jgi:hypothetical protein